MSYYVIMYQGQFFFDNYLGSNHYTTSLDLARRYFSLSTAKIAKEKYDIKGKIRRV